MNLKSIKDKIKDKIKGIEDEKINVSMDINIGKDMKKVEKECTVKLISSSMNVFLAANAAKICVGMEAPRDYAKCLEMIEKIINMGHESVTEHTWLMCLVTIPKDTKYVMQMLTFCTNAPFLKFATTNDDDNGAVRVLIAGSIRAYKDAIRTCVNKYLVYNEIYIKIKKFLEENVAPVFLYDLCKENICNKYELGYVEPDTHINPAIHLGTYADLITTHETFENIMNKVQEYGFTEYSVEKMVPITFVFHDISRPISMQIIRHRNAISQESQRYVNYSDKGFVDPLKYINQSDKKLSILDPFNPDEKNRIEMSSKELGEILISIYKDLIDEPNKLLKQDARSFLPSNVITKLMMTFTYFNFRKFIELRVDKHAQPEIQAVAKSALELIPNYDKAYYENNLKHLIEK